MQQKNSRWIPSILVILILVLVPVSQTISPNLNFLQPQTASATGGIALNNVQSTSGTVSSSPYQITISNFNAGTSSNQLIVVGVEANNEVVTSVTFGGVSLTKETSSFHNNYAAFWYLVNPSGTGNIVVTMNGATSVVVGAYAFSGVDQTTPLPTNAANYNTAASSPTISLTTQYSNSWVLDLPAIYGGVTLGSPTCTKEWDINIASAITGASSYTTTSSPGSVTCSWTTSGGGDLWDDVAIEVKASSSTTPSAPLSPTAPALSTSQLELKWTTPSSNGGSQITGYQVQKASASWATIVNNTGTTTTNYNVTGLASNSKYTYRIAAWNSVGLGAWSTNDTNSTIPGSPTSLTATGVSSSQINLSWTAPSGNATISGYKIERTTDEGSTWSTLVANTGSSATTYSDTGLSQGTYYGYRVSAINTGGTSSPSSDAFPPQWFDISASPSSLTIQRNSSGTSTITLYGTYGFNNNVNLSLFSPPKGVTGSFSPSRVLVPTTGQITSTLTINTNSSATIGTQNITVLGQSGSVTNETSISLTITGSSSWHSSAGIVLPLYTYPYTNSTCTHATCFAWNSINQTHNQYPHVPIVLKINPGTDPVGGNNGGPCYNTCVADPGFQKGIANLTKSGIIVVGYVPTGSGTVSLSTVNASIDDYANWYKPYGLTGISFDEMDNSANCPKYSYYADATARATQDKLNYTIGNPGTSTQKCYVPTENTINVVDSSILPSISELVSRTYATPNVGFNKYQFSIEPYGQSSLPSNQTIGNFTNFVGLMDISNMTCSCWDHIPPYFSTLAAILNKTSALVTINAQDSSGHAINNFFVEVHQNGNEIPSGNTTLSFNGTVGVTYQFDPLNYTNIGCTFQKWQDTQAGPANRTVTIPSGGEIYTAIYQGSSCP